ncbi:MAG: desulfoferrodoxin family protein [Candidatus Caccovivens sp.]
MSKIKIYLCPICGRLVVEEKGGTVPSCCNKDMELLSANIIDASHEKHLPVIEQEHGRVIVKVGSVIHPMTPEHFIKLIVLETNKGFYLKELTPDVTPEAKFTIAKENVAGTYAYCNLHGLWYTELSHNRE